MRVVRAVCCPFVVHGYHDDVVVVLVAQAMAVFASGVVAIEMCDSERKTRRLFVLEYHLKTKKKVLLDHINPFSADHLKEWMDSGSLEANKSANDIKKEEKANDIDNDDTTQATDYSAKQQAPQNWQLDRSQLKLIRRIASGSSGIVWQAYYKRNLVAAKQLYVLLTQPPHCDNCGSGVVL